MSYDNKKTVSIYLAQASSYLNGNNKVEIIH